MSDEEPIIEEPPTEEPKPQPTKLQQFIERLSQYPDRETAKTHILEISKELGCAKTLGYKALKHIEQFQPSKTEAIEPTAKIPETRPETLEESETPPPPEEIAEAEAEIEQPPPPPQPQGFREEDLEWMFDKGFSGLAKLTGYADFSLDKADSKKLGEIWTPILNQYLPSWIPYAPIAIAAITTTAIVAPKVKGYWDFRKKKSEEKPVEKPAEKPKEETKPEAKSPLGETAATERPRNAPFVNKL